MNIADPGHGLTGRTLLGAGASEGLAALATTGPAADAGVRAPVFWGSSAPAGHGARPRPADCPAITLHDILDGPRGVSRPRRA